MIALGGQFLDIMVIIMLAVVGGLVLWLHYKLYTLKNADKAVPSLVVSLSDSLQKAHRGVFELSRLVREDGPKLESEIFKAQQTVQDLDYMLDKAERLLKRMDNAFEKADKVVTPLVVAKKSSEKEMLTGKKPEFAAAHKPTAPKVTAQRERPVVTEAAKRLEVEMQKTLERDLLMGMSKPEKDIRIDSSVDETEVVIKRMASPQHGAMAYGQQLSDTSDAEKSLRQALEGRL